MDWLNITGKTMETLKKYRYVLLVLLAGLLLMALPEGEREEASQQPEVVIQESSEGLQEALETILSQLEGAGKVRVLLTESSGEETLYQTDEDRSVASDSSDLRLETVILTDGSRGEAGLIRQINPPTYQGAIVLCQGADSASVRLSIAEAVAAATGLSYDHITVLKMK